jgi:hypothetical protein
MATDNDTKVRENRSRRAAERAGLRLVKSARRDPNALDFNLFALIDERTDRAINPPLLDRLTCSWTLDEVEHYLTKPKPRSKHKPVPK